MSPSLVMSVDKRGEEFNTIHLHLGLHGNEGSKNDIYLDL